MRAVDSSIGNPKIRFEYLAGSIVGFGQGNVDANGQDMGFGVGCVAVVKAHGAIGAEVVGVAGIGGVDALDTVGAAARGNLAFAVEDKIDLLGDFVVMREVGAGGGEVHEEEIDDVVGGVNAVTERLWGPIMSW
jgi:hypothetical protein